MEGGGGNEQTHIKGESEGLLVLKDVQSTGTRRKERVYVHSPTVPSGSRLVPNMWRSKEERKEEKVVKKGRLYKWKWGYEVHIYPHEVKHFTSYKKVVEWAERNKVELEERRWVWKENS